MPRTRSLAGFVWATLFMLYPLAAARSEGAPPDEANEQP
ncbi:unnamed protein product, partial [marine sediment metagenome]